jgi:hypothetical protein
VIVQVLAWFILLSILLLTKPVKIIPFRKRSLSDCEEVFFFCVRKLSRDEQHDAARIRLATCASIRNSFLHVCACVYLVAYAYSCACLLERLVYSSSGDLPLSHATRSQNSTLVLCILWACMRMCADTSTGMCNPTIVGGKGFTKPNDRDLRMPSCQKYHTVRHNALCCTQVRIDFATRANLDGEDLQ